MSTALTLNNQSDRNKFIKKQTNKQTKNNNNNTNAGKKTRYEAVVKKTYFVKSTTKGK